MDYKYITFTGHRFEPHNAVSIKRLEWVLKLFPSPEFTWIHGGAKEGFDAQVQAFIEANNILHKIFRPDYKKYSDRINYAPIARNYEMVDLSVCVVACWDGRQTGGTWSTVKYAIEKNITVIRLPYTVPISHR